MRNMEKQIGIVGAVLALTTHMMLYCSKLRILGNISVGLIWILTFASLLYALIYKKNLIWSVLAVTLLILSTVINKSLGQIPLGLAFVTYIQGMNKKQIFEIFFYTIFGYFIMSAIACLVFKISYFDANDDRGKYLCLIFNSKHAMALYYMLLITAASYLFYHEDAKSNILFVWVGSAVMMYLTAARGELLPLMLMPILYIIFEKYPKTRKYVKYMPILFLVISLILMTFVTVEEPFRTFKMRFGYPRIVYQTVLPPIWGYNVDLGLLTYKIVKKYFDNSYLYILMQFGIFSIIFYTLYILMAKKNEDDAFISSYLAIMFMTAIMEQLFLNFIVLWPIVAIFKDKKLFLGKKKLEEK